MKALIDADTYPWRWAAAGEYDNYLVRVDGEEFIVRGKREALKKDEEPELIEHVIDPIENILHSVKLSIEEIKEVCGDKTPRLFLGGKGNFRETVYPEYKANRKGRPKPFHYDAVKEYLVKKYKAEVVDGMEADDALGIYNDGETTVMCSQDKDLLQIAGHHYNYVTKEQRRVGRKEADFNLYAQVISGDTTDNIPGCKGIGIKTAEKLVAGATSVRDLLDRAHKAYEEDTDRMVLNAQLIYLLRGPDDSFLKRPEIEEFLNAKT